MFENSPIIKDHSRPAVELAASGIIIYGNHLSKTTQLNVIEI